jgi:hypothetical protein
MTARDAWLEAVVIWNAKRLALIEAERALREASIAENAAFIAHIASDNE